MLGSYLKSVLRNIRREKLYSLINILGLGLGIGIVILSLLYTDFNFRSINSMKIQIEFT